MNNILSKIPLFLLLLLMAVFSCENNSEDSGENSTSGGLDFGECSTHAETASGKQVPDYNLWKIENGKFYLDGQWKFLKIAKPLKNFADRQDVAQLINDLDVLDSKQYDVIEINCYWHHFDNDGDGVPDVSLEPLRDLIDSVYARGMYPSLSVETYAVGGGTIPEGFWTKNPNAYAINDQGERVTDTEYGFGSEVVSIFHSGYRQTARTFIKSLAEAVDTKKILYFETTVEPQYMGIINLDYSSSARAAFHQWLEERGSLDASSRMPESFPIPQSFVTNSQWNKFRAHFLADWVNGDAAAYRDIAGVDAYVAVDYLDAEEDSMEKRVGNPEEFLAQLTSPDIIQVNWSWFFPENRPNQKAYDRVWKVMNDENRAWAVTEHMTFNGSDFTRYTNEQLEQILMNTLEQGTRFGWEFVSVNNNRTAPFSLYNDDWSPKRVMKIVDDQWNCWMEQVKEIEKNKEGA